MEKKKAPVKKVPAKKTSAPLKKPTVKKSAPVKKKLGEQIAVFVDLDNTSCSRENLHEILLNLEKIGDISYAKVYGLTIDRERKFDDIIAEYRIESVGLSRIRTEGVSVIDPRLTVDLLYYTDKHRPDHVFVWAGVGDMVPIFTQLVHMGAKTITVDLPEFDTGNKFVDKKIKLFSAHGTTGEKKAVGLDYSNIGATQPTMETPIAELSAFGNRKIPQLPRKKGAPSFGETGAKSSLYDEAEEEEIVDYEDEFEDEDFDLEGFDYDDDEGESAEDDPNYVSDEKIDAMEKYTFELLQKQLEENRKKPVKIDFEVMYEDLMNDVRKARGEKPKAELKKETKKIEPKVEPKTESKPKVAKKVDDEFGDFGDL